MNGGFSKISVQLCLDQPSGFTESMEAIKKLSIPGLRELVERREGEAG